VVEERAALGVDAQWGKSMPLVYPLFYYQRPRSEGRKVRMGFHVDVAAAWSVAAALGTSGYELGEMFFNYPPPSPGEPALLPIDVSGVRPEDLILTSTRFESEPEDPEVMCRKRVQRGHTTLEQDIEAAWRRYIHISERLRVVVQPRVAKYFEPGYENRFYIRFHEAESAPYKKLTEPTLRDIDRKPPPATVGYVLRLRELWPGGPNYLGFFGLDSTMALLLAHLLRRRHAELLHEEGFAIVELNGSNIPARAPDMRWSLGWESRVILRAPVHLAPNKLSA
jgi:hypothetical protein